MCFFLLVFLYVTFRFFVDYVCGGEGLGEEGQGRGIAGLLYCTVWCFVLYFFVLVFIRFCCILVYVLLVVSRVLLK